MNMYHGSKNGLRGNIKPISRDLCDFGKGFYMGESLEQPSTLICNYPNSVIYTLELDLTDISVKEIPLDLDWALFVAFNRGKLTKEKSPELFKKYSEYKNNVDLFKGYIANDRMFVVMDRFFDGTITDKALIESLSALKLGIQYVAITQKACDKIKIVDNYKFSVEERNILIKKSEENRKQGISLADDICRKFRREGKYFDELFY